MALFDLEPGPFVPEALPLGPRIVTPGTFLGLGGALIAVLGGTEQRSGDAAARFAVASAGELGLDFDQAIAGATVGLTLLDRPEDAADVGAAFLVGDAVEGTATTQQRDFPGPEDPEPDLGLGRFIEPEPEPGVPPGDAGTSPPFTEVPIP